MCLIHLSQFRGPLHAVFVFLLTGAVYCEAQGISDPSGMLGTSATPSPACSVTPFTTDRYTTLLDHFNGTTIGDVSGAVSYAGGGIGLGRSLVFGSGSSVKYPLSGWFQWSADYNQNIGAGSIELWIKPAKGVAGDFLMINWSDVTSPPSAGYITHLGLDASGRLYFGGWSSIDDNPFDTLLLAPHTILPTNAWSKIVYAWGPSGTSLYVNDSLEATSELNYYPAFNSTVYLYLNPFGNNVLEAVDELRISSIARASFGKCSE